MQGNFHLLYLSKTLRYFFHIGYSGTHYKGWQRHPYGVGVQQVIEECLKKILKQPVAIVGCGRTDAGVHASQFFFHLDVAQPWDFDMLFRLNKVLPPDIAVFDILPVEGLPHARFDACQRSYDYFIHTYKDPFLHDVSALYPLRNLNLEAMQAATALLPLYSDYRNLCLTPADHDSTICHVTEARWLMDTQGDRLRFQISANRFLSRMIRILVGQLLKIGTGALSLPEFESYLALETAPKHLTPAYPQGLYLSKVTYPFLDIPPRPSFSPAFRQV
ncbi:tRNA pseudouridine synthase A [Pontibacter sp. BT731]|uniref:tRNA pseudouridine synthase A n=1 Tax=Pontibacter coccineus TaxID=3063328 RepID=UPI0026E3E390|nr:tRNA pseudouridine synthase A [Pontibacter sp. BT731]MDO6388695.1 tRNA pseudouridine synthase A [Pontibacter sp. BT731]